MYLVLNKDFPHDGSKIRLRNDQVHAFVQAFPPEYWNSHVLMKEVDPALYREPKPIRVAREVMNEYPHELKYKIQAIKDLRGRLNIGLREAKDLIDGVWGEDRPH